MPHIKVETDPPETIELPDDLTDEEIAETVFEVYGIVKWKKTIVFTKEDMITLHY